MPHEHQVTDRMTKALPSILLVDDDQQLRTMLAELLRLENYEVQTAGDGQEALTVFGKHRFDLVILDVMMPVRDGFSTLRRLRTLSSCPVIMLTARGEADDRITGLESGADDYIAKPFNPRELLLRVQAILKRSMTPPGQESQLLEAGALSVDAGRMRATLEGESLALTGAELRILEALMRSPGRPVSRENLNQFALGRELTPYDRALDTHISNLRGKLRSARTEAPKIQSVRGEGYLLVVD